MPETAFIVTIDTEGDDLWSRPRRITTRNAEYLPRFQGLCERFDFKPVYLVNYEMARSDFFVGFARDAVARDAAEVGMHLHAWNSPPLVALTDDDFQRQPYLTDYPEKVMREKIRVLTNLLEDRFERPVISHRAGRWGMDARYAELLLEAGYRVDCSVTPGIDWRWTGGPDYRKFPERPYFLRDELLEVPVTIRSSGLYRRAPWIYRVPVLRFAARHLSRAPGWICPTESNLDIMLDIARGARAEAATHVEFVLHSSELMPGGSPWFGDASAIERLYADLERLFTELATWCRGMTLREFRAALQ